MITLHSFTEAYTSYTQGRIPLRLLQDQALVLNNLCPEGEPNLPPVFTALDITQEHIDWILHQRIASLPYCDVIGGNVHVCKTEEDLQQIQGCDVDWAEQHGGKWPSCRNLAMAWDVCDYLAEAEGQPQWAVFLSIWNEAGGPLYFVPRHLWSAARLEEHMALTNQYWTFQGNT
jgi:hypothetical protein